MCGYYIEAKRYAVYGREWGPSAPPRYLPRFMTRAEDRTLSTLIPVLVV